MTEFIIYYFLISAISIGFTIYDKLASQTENQTRISEDTFMLLALFGGALAMLLMMLFIRHKTKHKKFMIGLPVIILLQILAVILLFFVKII